MHDRIGKGRGLVLILSAGMLPLLAAGARAAGAQAAGASAAPNSGIDTGYVLPGVRPQDDLYRHLNGKWLEEFKMPPDKAVYVSFTAIKDRTQDQLRQIVEALPQAAAAGGDARKLDDLYASFMDERRLDQLDLAPLEEVFSVIDHLDSKHGIPALIARFNRTGLGAPLDFGVGPDARDSVKNAVRIVQSGLSMPDRDYYLKDDAKLKEIRGKFLVHVEKMLRMAGDARAHESAAQILDLETRIAQRQWTRIESRDPIKTYNKKTFAELPKLLPDFEVADDSADRQRLL